MKKFLLGIIALVTAISFSSSAYALNTIKGEYPDIPEGLKNAFIVAADGYETSMYAIEDTENYDSWKDVANTMYVYDSSTQTMVEQESLVKYYVLDNNSWVYRDTIQQGNLNAIIGFSSLVYSEANIYNYNGELEASSGYGTPIGSLFSDIGTVATGFFGALASATSALIGNSIFQIAFGIGMIFIAIGITYSLLRKTRNRGR